jgi:hypothetical protein
MTKKGSFYVPIYNCIVNIIISDDLRSSINSCYKKYKQKKIKKKDTPGALCFSPDDCSHTYYLFFDKDTIDINYINHEKSHLVEFILEERDIKARDEVRAYLDGFISEKSFQLFKRLKIRLK